MNDLDVLKRASKALRESHDGARNGAGFTKARVLKTLQQRRKRRLLGWTTLGPVLALALGGTAWAEATGQLPMVWAQIVSTFTPDAQQDALAERAAGAARPKSDKRARAEPAQMEPTRIELSALPELVAPVESAAPTVEVAQESATPEVPNPPPPAVPVAQPVGSSRASRVASRNPSTRMPVAAKPEERVSLEDSGPELVAYRAAHDAHFHQQSPGQAVTAYRTYLKQYPGGRFVPEARYNLALDLIRTGQVAEARTELQAFANGRYGTYRQTEATDLLEALH